MAIQRGVVSGTIAGVVQTRTVFTCDVIVSGGDTAEVLWTAYITNIYAQVNGFVSNVWQAQSYELSIPSAGHWVPFLVHTLSFGGGQTGDYLPNAVSAVLLGKAAGLRHVGRKFFGPIVESLTTANSLAGAGITAAAATLLAYITPFTGTGGGIITPGVVDQAGDFHPFVGGVVSTILGSMRRRKPGLGI